MDIRLKILSIVSSVVLFVLVIILVKKRKLSERASLFWFILAFSLLVSTLNFNLMVRLSKFLGILDPNNMLLFFGVLFLIIVSLYLSIRVSDLDNKVKNLAQDKAILQTKLEKLDDKNKN